MDRASLQTLGRAGLQRLAKEKGVRAVGPSSKIIDELLKCGKGNATSSEATQKMQRRGSNLFKDVKNHGVEKGEQKEATDGSQKFKRLATTPGTTEVTTNADRPDATGTRASREKTVVVSSTTDLGTRSPSECVAVEMLLSWKAKRPLKSEAEEPPATGRKRKRDQEEREQVPVNVPKQTQKRRKTRRA